MANPKRWGIFLALTLLSPAAYAAAGDDAQALDDRVESLYADKRYEEAEVFARESLEVRRAALGDDHLDVAKSLLRLASVLNKQAKYDEASARYEECIAIRRVALGPDHPDLAFALNNLALVLRAQGQNEAAVPLFRESLAIWKEKLGPHDLKVALGQNNLAAALKARGEYDEAKSLYEQALAIRKAVDADHPRVAMSLNNLADVLKDQGDLDGARALMEQALAFYRRVHGDDHLRVALMLNNLGSVLIRMGDRSAARPLQERSLEIRIGKLGPEHLDVATSLNNLGSTLRGQGDYAAARPLLERSLAIWRKVLGEDHTKVGIGMSNLASLLHSQGDLETARTLYEQSLTVHRAAGNEGATGLALNNLATVLTSLRDHETARSLLEESLVMRRARYGDVHVQVALSLSNLATVMNAQKDHSAAEKLLEESLEIYRQVLDDDHPDIANGLSSLGLTRQAQGDFDGARALFERSLAIRRSAHGDDHPRVARNLKYLARLEEKAGNLPAARQRREEALTIVEGRLWMLDALSEREALIYLPRRRTTLDGWLAITDASDSDAWSHVLKFKGAIAARLSAARVWTRDNPEAAAIAAELTDVRRQMARLALSADLEDRKTRLSTLSEKRDRLERSLLQQSAATRAANDIESASPKKLCAALPTGAALLDLYRYKRQGEYHYVAFTAVAGTCDIRRTELGLAKPLEDAVADWRSLLQDPDATAARVDTRGAYVNDLLWAKLAPLVGSATHLFVVPDGALASAPLSALPIGDGRYLLEDRAITWLDRANDILLPSAAGAAGALVVGDVEYDAVATGGESEHRGVLAPCNKGDFPPLPGAAAEAESIAERWRKTRKKEPLTHLFGATATEASVTRELEGKAVVHLATHGFFATGHCKSALAGDGTVGFDPMVLSGLVFAGANQPANPLALNDGILTAAEVASLDLSGTSLVVLSACETGLGEIRSGEGVLGLRRAFRVAGAQTLVMTLWSVSDDNAASLMDAFYRLLLHRRRPVAAAEALRTAQLDALRRQRAIGVVKPGAWAGFIAAGDWR